MVHAASAEEIYCSTNFKELILVYLKTSNKKQLAAAVTLAVMGMAWVAVPSQVWAADGGSQDHPRQYSSYTADSDRAIAIAREQKTGEDMYAAQYHENFADLAFRAKDDMGGKTITLKSMTVEGIIGADGKGAAAGLPVEESTAGKNGGIGSAVGIYSTNILNANITFGDIAIKAIGGNTYSQEITSGKYTHEGKAGVDGASDKNLNGGAGANGGNGGLAIATGVDITGSNNTVTGGVLTVTATGSDGGHGGYGGAGGTAAAITTVPAKAGNGVQGNDGADSTTSGTTPSTPGANGTIGGAGGAGLAGAGGTAGTVGAVGLTGGIGGNGSNGGSGSNAEATGLKIAGSGTATTISLGGLVVEAAAGNGGAGGAGGAGGIGGVGGTGGIGGNGGDGGDGGDGDLVHLVGDGQMLHTSLLLDGLGDHSVDVGIALVGDDALSIVVHFLLAVLDVLVDVGDQVLIQLQLFHDLVVALEQLDGVPAQEAVIHLALNGLFDVGNGVLHTAGKHMGQLAGLFALGSGHGSLGSCLGALALQGADLDRLAAQLGAQLLQVDLVAVLAHQVDHVHSHDHRDAQLDQLGGQVQVALDVGAVDDVQDGVGLLLDQISTGDDFLQRVRRQRVDTGQVLDDDILVALQLAFLLFHGNAGPVADVLVGAGQVVEQGRFTAVRVAGKCNF